LALKELAEMMIKTGKPFAGMDPKTVQQIQQAMSGQGRKN
jgi:hypothetical protein